MERPEFYRFHQGEKSLPFDASEYANRLKYLRADMQANGVDACMFTSIHNVAYYSGFLYCAFGRPYAFVVTQTEDVMELEIAKRFPNAEYRDTWVWFQSGINTDGARNPVISRALQSGDILSLNTFPMISAYYTALERTLFVENVDPASLKI